MRAFILLLFLSLFIGFSTASKASTFSINSLNFPSEESSEKDIFKENSSDVISTKSVEPAKQKTKTKKQIKQEKKQRKQLAKQNRKEFRKAIWTTIKEQRKTNKENRKNGIKEKGQKIHWAAYVSFFSALTGLGIIATTIILGTTGYTIGALLPLFAIGLLILSVITAIIGISVVANKDITLYHKSHTMTLALIGGIASLLSLLLIGFVIVAISALSY